MVESWELRYGSGWVGWNGGMLETRCKWLESSAVGRPGVRLSTTVDAGLVVRVEVESALCVVVGLL